MYGCIILYSGGVLFSFFFIFGSRYGLQCQQDRAASTGTGGDRATDASASRRRRPRVAACASGPSPAGRRPRGQGPGPRPLARGSAHGAAPPVPPLRRAGRAHLRRSVYRTCGVPPTRVLCCFFLNPHVHEIHSDSHVSVTRQGLTSWLPPPPARASRQVSSTAPCQ